MGTGSPQKMRQNKNLERFPDSTRSETALGCIIIEKLLDEYLEVMRQYAKDEERMSVKQKKLFELLPHDNKIRPPKESYQSILFIVDFVSSMTDRYAYDFFRKLSGTQPMWSM